MKEEVFRYGENNRGFGMVTLPDDISDAPVVVAFNAGLIHREGPYRLNVRICRSLANLGYISIRLDLSGKGDTPTRQGLKNRQSVALDWQFTKESILNRFGQRNLILVGLCSGADNIIKIAAEEKDVSGLVVIDSVSPLDSGFRRRELVSKLLNRHKWKNLPYSVLKRIQLYTGLRKDINKEMWDLRDPPTQEDIQQCFCHIARRRGKALLVFTSHALIHYNQQGQFVRALKIPKLEQCCEEVFWPLVDHIFVVQSHRDRLVKKIVDWGDANMAYFRRKHVG